jgi:hypothetical protein
MQMLVLTCHEHVTEMFRAAGATVRPLSGDPPPRRVAPPPRPAPLPSPPAPVVVVEPACPPAAKVESGAWPAEEFFFGNASDDATPATPDAESANAPSRPRSPRGRRPRA